MARLLDPTPSSWNGQWRTRFRPLRSALLAVCIPLFYSGAVRAEREETVKIAYLLNFAKLVEWPSTAFTAGQSLVVGVVGRDPLGDELTRVLAGASANGRKLEIRRVSAADESGLQACHLVFVLEAERADLVLGAVKGRPVLVVGEGDNFAQRGGALGFVNENGTVKFEANPKAAARNGLIVSARLLRVARGVVER